MKNSLSVSLVVYNEEANIKRCLDSLRKVVDEIIIVHDGPCTDSTLSIARKYTNKIFTRPRIGEAEPHRPFALSKTTSEWVIALDADEFLSDELCSEIKNLTKENSVDGYEFYWPVYDKGKKITKGPLSKTYRLALFRRLKTQAPKRFHEWYKVNGSIKRVDLTLEHNVPQDNWTYSGFKKKHMPRAKYDARFRIINGSAKAPAIVYFFKSILWFCLILPYSYFYNRLLINGELGLRMALLISFYNFFVYFYVFKIKITGKMPQFNN